MPINRTELIDSLFTTTFYRRQKELHDQVVDAVPFYKWLNLKGQKKERPGGLALEKRIRVGKNITTTWLGRGDTVPITDTEYAILAKFDWKYVATTVRRYWVDDIKQDSNEKLVDYVTEKLDTSRSDMTESINDSLMVSGGTAKHPLAISELVADNPTVGLIGEVDRAAFPMWRNQFTDAVGQPATLFLMDLLRTMHNKCSVGAQTGTRIPDFHLTNQALHELFEAEAEGKVQIINQKLADLGFTGVTYKGKPVEYDDSVGNRWYMLNSNHLELAISSTAPFELDEWKPIVDQPKDRVTQIIASLALVSNQLRKNGVIFNLTP